METIYYLVPLFFLTALVYSMAGFGGGSTYLALLVLFAVPYVTIPKVALLCNLIVVTSGCWFFIRQGNFSPRRVLPFMVTSIPAAYLGGKVPIGKEVFEWLLAVSLLVAASRMFLSEKAFRTKEEPSWRRVWQVGLPLGILLGGLSGLVGIGGGIFLSPVLLLLGWADARQAAAAASVFILVNSLAGLAGQLAKGGIGPDELQMIPLLVAVFFGGQIGSRLGSARISRLSLQRVTAVLILFVAARLFIHLI